MADNEKVSKNRIIGGLTWVFGERMSAQLVSTLITIILARLLTPEHYGMISIVMVFITFLDVFVTSGFGSALVQKKDADAVDFDTAFLLSLGLSCVLYLGLFLVSPAIARFYEMPELSSVLRVMGFRLPLASVNNIQRSYIQRGMNFKRFFWVTLGSTVASGVIGVILANLGFGVWALTAQYLVNTAVTTVLLMTVSPWRPKLQFSLSRAKAIFSFGWKVLATQLVATLESDIRSLIVGKVFGSADLAYYDQGKKYPALLVTNISSSIDSVMLPAFSKEQDDRQRILAMLRRSVRIGIYVMAPVLLGFAAVSESFVKLLLTDKWLPCVPFMQVFCLVYMTRPLESSCRQALLSIGRSGIVLISIILINIVALVGTVIAVFVFKNVFAVALVSLAVALVSLICFMSFSGHYLGYNLKMQMQDALPSLLLGLLMATVVYLENYLPLSDLLMLVIQVMTGAAAYVGGSVVLKLEPFRYLLDILKNTFKRKVG